MDPFALYKRIKNQGWPPAASRYAPKCTTAGTFPQRLRWSLTGRTLQFVHCCFGTGVDAHAHTHSAESALSLFFWVCGEGGTQPKKLIEKIPSKRKKGKKRRGVCVCVTLGIIGILSDCFELVAGGQ